MLKNDQSGFSTVLLVILGLILLVIVWQTAFTVLKSSKNNDNKQDLTTQISQYTFPKECKKTWERYSGGDGIDAAARWELEYTCSGKVDVLFQDLQKRVSDDGLTVKEVRPLKSLCTYDGIYRGYYDVQDHDSVVKLTLDITKNKLGTC